MKKHREQSPKQAPKQSPGHDRQPNKEPGPPSLEEDVDGAGAASTDVARDKDDVAWAPESGDKPEAAVPSRRAPRG